MMYNSEEDIFISAPTSLATSVYSQSSLEETVYDSATDLVFLSKVLQADLTDKEQSILNQNTESKENSLEASENRNFPAPRNLIENDFERDETFQCVFKTRSSLAENTTKDVEDGRLVNEEDNFQNSANFNPDKIYSSKDISTSENQNAVPVVNELLKRMDKMSVGLSVYVPSAMSITSSPCSDNDISPKDIIKWLKDKKGNLTINEFLERYFTASPIEASVFKKLQSKIFMLFFLILCDVTDVFSKALTAEENILSNLMQKNFNKWLDETELIFEVLLKTSYINIDFSDINIPSLEQPVMVFKSIISNDSEQLHDFQKSLKEMKLLRKHMAGIPSKMEKIFIGISALMFIADIATDIVQTITYRNEGNVLWPVIAVFIIFPSLIGCAVSFAYWRRDHPKTRKEQRLKRLGLILIPLQLGEVWQQICRLFDKYLIMDSYNALSLLLMEMLEGLFEGGPQALVQTYVLFGQNITSFSFRTFIHIASPLLSSLSMAIGITNIDFARLSSTISFKTKAMFILCRLGEVWARFIVYVGTFYSFGLYGLLVIFIQVVLLMIPTVVLIRRDKTRQQSRDINCVYLGCRHGGFNAVKSTPVFKSTIVTWFVWISIPFLYSLVPLQRFELDFEYNGFTNKRPPFWKCNKHFAVYNILYALHQIFNIVGFVIWLLVGRITDYDFLVPICILFAFGTFISFVVRIQSWVGRTYNINLTNNDTYEYKEPGPSQRFLAPRASSASTSSPDFLLRKFP